MNKNTILILVMGNLGILKVISGISTNISLRGRGVASTAATQRITEEKFA